MSVFIILPNVKAMARRGQAPILSDGFLCIAICALFDLLFLIVWAAERRISPVKSPENESDEFENEAVW